MVGCYLLGPGRVNGLLKINLNILSEFQHLAYFNEKPPAHLVLCACSANETNYNISEGVSRVSTQQAICYSLSLPEAVVEKLDLWKLQPQEGRFCFTLRLRTNNRTSSKVWSFYAMSYISQIIISTLTASI